MNPTSITTTSRRRIPTLPAPPPAWPPPPLPPLTAALVDRLRSPAAGPVDVVTWAPTTTARRRQRGFDQAEHLARAVGAALAVPVRPCLIRRAGAAQTGRSAGERRRGP